MGVNSFRARSDSTVQLETGDVHVCHICLKQFSRRDLRERHRRRCEKSIGKIIPTKKRSCERCISFKVKCDYEKPSCSRCLNRSVPCEYKLEPRVKMPLNPAFSLGPNTAFSGSLDVFSVQDGHQLDMDSTSDHVLFGPQHHQHQHQRPRQNQHQHQHQHRNRSCNDYYPDWSSSDGAGYAHALDASQWDATTVWSDASSSLLDPLMLDEAVMESSWATNFLDPAVCMDVYDQHCMLYGQDVDQPISRHLATSTKRVGKSAFLSY
ncbi:hypothetical protein E4U53_003929 [Claviceps sorghi]|nr:hypothetical protein E4U53_003929 [Claviceps sorghi]